MTTVPQVSHTGLSPTGVASAGPLSAEELAALVAQAADAAGFKYFYGETDEDLVFQAYPLPQPPGFWKEARVFGETGMLHWRRLVGSGQPRFQVVFLGSLVALPPNMIFELFDSQQFTAVATAVRLRGRRLAGQPAWLEPRTPRLLDYPWQDEKTPELALRLIEYRHAGRVEFVQWVGLQPWKASE